jgi:hypothetical protein
MTDENGNVSYVTIERADEPVVEGTPLNAETFNALFLYTESENHPGCYYRTVDGEAEWLNPPMIVNTPYRTTKRFNGYPVYTVAVSFPELAAEGGVVTKQFINGTISKVLKLSTLYYHKVGAIGASGDPMVDSDGVYAKTKMVTDGQYLVINCRKDMTNYSAVCFVEFTQAEEAL